jgi:HEAT repeat protein
LAKKGADVRNGLLDAADDPKRPAHARIAALGALNSLWNDEVRDECLNLLYAGDPNLRRLAADALALNCKPGDPEADTALLQVLGDQDLAARRAIVLAIARIGGPSAVDSLVNTFRANRELDSYWNDAILRALERLGQPGIAKLVALAQSGVEKDFDKVVAAFQGLRSRAAAEAIPDLLTYPHLSILERANLVKSYSNYTLDPPIALTPLLKYLDAHKDEPARVKLAALEVLTIPGQPKSEKAEELAVTLLEQKDEDFRAAVLQAIERGRLAEALRKQVKDPEVLKLLAEIGKSNDK